MNNYQKIWRTVFGLMIFAFFGLLIYAGTTSENRGIILQTINTLNTKSIRNILIAPENPEWKINLTVDTLSVDDKNKVDEIIHALKKLRERHLTKGAKRFWESILIINFDNPYSANLKTRRSLLLEYLIPKMDFLLK